MERLILLKVLADLNTSICVCQFCRAAIGRGAAIWRWCSYRKASAISISLLATLTPDRAFGSRKYAVSPVSKTESHEL